MGLLREKKFAPFFWTQFLGAFNDNMFKNALVIIIAFNAIDESESGFFVNLAAGLFILPFFLLSPLAGQLSDKYEKSNLIRLTKIAEIVIMAMAAGAFFLGNNMLLVAILFFMGAQSTFFGPVKYSILPQHLSESEIMQGTGLVEMGTFVAILLGTIAGGLIAELSPYIIGLALLLIATIGWWTSRLIPEASASSPKLKIEMNPIGQFKDLFKAAKRTHSVWLSIIGISWFWFFGATFLAQMPSYVKFTVSGDKDLVTLFLSFFTISMAIGSTLCSKLADSAIELGLVPLGALGLSLFAFDLSIVDYAFFSSFTQGTLDISTFFSIGFSSYRIIFDLSMIGIFGSFFIVPLYALIQSRSDEAVCSRVIAANNVINALFMVGSAIMTMVLFKWGLGPMNDFKPFTTTDVFMIVAFMNLVVAVYIFSLLPEFVLRFGSWVLARTIYRLRYEGRELFPRTGPVVVVANHISFIDWFVLSAACQRPIHFVMDHRIFKIPILSLFFKLGKCIPIAPEKEDPECKRKAFEKISEALKNGDVVGIFPEGKISYDGNLDIFKPGIEKIIDSDPVPVVPVAIHGLWGSFFSRYGGPAMAKVPKPKKRKIKVKIAEPIQSDGGKATAESLQGRVQGMLDELASTY
ncbi:MAG: MFS transporter [Bdellovibrionota bacterium]